MRSGAARRRDRVAPALFFAGVTLVLLGFSAWSVRRMGYTDEDLRAVHDGLSLLRSWLGGPAFHPTHFPRHGAASIAGHVPFVLAARLLFGGAARAEDRLVSLEPILATALVAAILFLWIRRAGGGAARARAIALIAAFGTLLWPYSYIGLETMQSAALMAAGYLALATGRRSAGRAVLFSAAAALALSAKATSVFLLPAVGYLGVEFFREGFGRRRRATAIAGALFVLTVFSVNAWTRHFWWAQLGGTGHVVEKWLVRDPAVVLVHLVSLLGSANKGLFFYAPVALAAALAAPHAWRRDRRVVVFAGLALLGLAGGFSLIRNWWSDETWGPRYLHSAVAPLVLLLGTGWAVGEMPRRWRRAVGVLGAAGVAISFLGAFFPYGALQGACTAAGQSTLEALQGDPVWNHVVFNGRLFRAWARGADRPGAAPAVWVPAHYWWYETPRDFRGWPGIDLRRFARPRPLVFRRGDELGPGDEPLRSVSFAALAAGLLLLAIEARRGREAGEEDGGRGGAVRAGALVLFAAVLAAAWARSWVNTLDGRFYLGAREVDDSPAFRRALAAAERAAPAGSTLLGIVDGPDWDASHWSKWLYPRRILWMSPENARRQRRWLVEGLGVRYAIVVGRAALRVPPEADRLVAAGGGAEIRALAP